MTLAPILFALFAATIPLANFLISNVGSCVPQGPCLIPVGFGLWAPSGVLVVGLALVVRDLIHRLVGRTAALVAILVGAGLSLLLAPPALAVASVVAFVVAEFMDWAAYSVAIRRGLPLAILVSGLVGALADSAAFLWLAFGDLSLLAGQVVGKLYAAAAVAGGAWAISRLRK